MAITLSPELESRIEEELKSGEYESAEQLIERALNDMEMRRRIACGIPSDELDALLQEAEEAESRGEVYTPEQVRAHMAAVESELERG